MHVSLTLEESACRHTNGEHWTSSVVHTMYGWDETSSSVEHKENGGQ